MADIVDGFAIHSTHDERGTRGTCLGFALDEQAANVFAMGKGWYGGLGAIVPCKFLHIDDDFWPLYDGESTPAFIQTNGQSLRAQALAKLTPEERKELGV